MPVQGAAGLESCDWGGQAAAWAGGMGGQHPCPSAAAACLAGLAGSHSGPLQPRLPAAGGGSHCPNAADMHVGGAELCTPRCLSAAGFSNDGRRVTLPVSATTSLLSPPLNGVPCSCVPQAAALHWRGARLRRGFRAWRSAVASKVAVQQHCFRSLLRRGLQGFISATAAARRLRSATWQRLISFMQLPGRH